MPSSSPEQQIEQIFISLYGAYGYSRCGSGGSQLRARDLCKLFTILLSFFFVGCLFFFYVAVVVVVVVACVCVCVLSCAYVQQEFCLLVAISSPSTFIRTPKNINLLFGMVGLVDGRAAIHVAGCCCCCCYCHSPQSNRPKPSIFGAHRKRVAMSPQ